MSTQPEVSVVLATNRVSPYLDQAIRSLQAQSLRDWELVVVDDGSPDPASLEQLLAGVNRARIVRQENRGLAAARNVGCDAAGGRYLTFLDDDDFWPAERLAAQVAALGSRPDALGCYGRLSYVDAEGEVFGAGPDCSGDEVALSAGFHIGTLLVRRSALSLAGGFNPLLPAAEDLDFSLRLGQVGPLLYLPETLLFYRRHGGNMTSRRREVMDLGQLVYRQHLQLARLTSRLDAVAAIEHHLEANERYFGLESARAARRLARSGDFRGALTELRAAALSAGRLGLETFRRPWRQPAGRGDDEK